MPYILVSNIKKLPLQRDRRGALICRENTYIECQDYQVDGRSVLGYALSSVGVTRLKPGQYDQLPARPIPCMYNTAWPPHLVLDALELQGYKVVASTGSTAETTRYDAGHTVPHTSTSEFIWTWTLHKPAY